MPITSEIRSYASAALGQGKRAVIQAKGYPGTIADRAESIFRAVKTDNRVTKVVETANSVTTTVLETVQGRVVKPVQSLTHPGAKATSTPAVKPATVTSMRPEAAKPRPKASSRKAPVKKITKA